MPIRAFVFDAYGTLFDVHAAIARHRAAAGPEADRFSELWRTKQLEYAWMLSAAGHPQCVRITAATGLAPARKCTTHT